MKPMIKRNKVDIGLVGQTINNTNVTGKYFSMAFARKALGILSIGAMAAEKTAKIEFLQAKDAGGTGAKAVAGADATITANAGVTVATLTLGTVLNTEAVTINGLTFTGHTNTTTAASRQFKIDGDDSADATALAGLINDATYGVPGVTATAASAVITLTATDPGETTITITDAANTIVPATVQAQSYVEIDASQLDSAGGFGYIAAKVTTTSTAGICAVTLLRGDGRFEPTQQVAAGKVL